MDRCDFAVGTATETLEVNQPQTAVGSVADAAFTARALVVVAALSGGVWYLLCKLSLHFMAGH